MLSDLIAKAKAWLGQKPPPEPTATDAIVHDDYDAMVFDDLLREAPALEQAVSRLEQEHPQARDLYRDTMMGFWQERPELRPAEDMAETHKVNQAVAQLIAELPETQQARNHTTWDRYGAAVATIGVSQKVNDILADVAKQAEEAEEAKRAAEEAAQQAAEQLAEAAQQAEQAQQDAEDATQQAEGAEGTEGEEEAQEAAQQAQEAAQQAADALAQAQQAAEDAAAQAEQAGQQVTETIQRALQPARSRIGQALTEAGERLDEEAELMSMAGVGQQQLERMSFTERANLANRLRNTKLARFRKMIGRMRRFASAYRSKKIEHGRDEVVDIELSGDLSRVLTSEILLADVDELRELDFLIRYTEDRLLSRKYVGVEEAGDGPIVVCLDETGSMQGPKEEWAKAFALALYDQARASRRDLVWIGWGDRSQQKVWRFPKGQGSLEDLLDAVEHFFHGSETYYEQPLRLALDVVTHDFDAFHRGKADIVFITDGQGQDGPNFFERFRLEKERVGFRVFGIGVDQNPGAMRHFADSLHHVKDLATGEDAAQVFARI